MINNEKFTKRLTQILETYNLSASAFAEKIGVGRSSISHILSGRNKPSLDFVMKIIHEFPEVDLYWLLEGKGSLSPTPILPKDKIDNSKEEQKHLENTSSVINSSEIDKIMVLYKNGTFEIFKQ